MTNCSSSIRAHLQSAHPLGGAIFVGVLNDPHRFVLPDELDAAVAHAESIDTDCYFTPGTFNGSERNLSGAIGATVAWCDVDNWTEQSERGVRLLEQELGDAVFVVDSRPGSPRKHVYVALKERIEPAALKLLNQRLVGLLGGDPSPVSAERWMRLAGTVNSRVEPDAVDWHGEEVDGEVTFDIEPTPGAAASIDKLLSILPTVAPKLKAEPRQKSTGELIPDSKRHPALVHMTAVYLNSCRTLDELCDRLFIYAKHNFEHLDDNTVPEIRRIAEDRFEKHDGVYIDEAARYPEHRETGDLVRLSTVVPAQTEYLWRPWIALGKVTIVDGDPGVGKSTLTTDIAACVSRGDEGYAQGDVVLVSGEDDLESTVAPRLLAARANADRVWSYPGPRDADGNPTPVKVPADIEWIERALLQTDDPKLLVIDPITAHLDSEVDNHRDTSVRTALLALRNLAEKLNIAIVVVRHLNKSGGANAIYRGGGSIGFIGAVRSGIMVIRDPDDDDQLVLAHYKCNYARKAESLTYALEEVEVGGGIPIARVEWRGVDLRSADDLLGVRDEGGRPPRASEHAKDWLDARRMTHGARQSAVEVQTAAADDAGISEGSLRRAKAAAGIESVRNAQGWFWQWPEPEQANE